MLIIDCFGHNIYIDKELVGYIQENELIITGRKFADITDDGIISFGTKEVGFIDDDGIGHWVDKEGNDLGYIRCNVNWLKSNQPKDAKFIMWYNK